MIEWVALGGSPAEFWGLTPRLYVTIMQGMARAANKRLDDALYTAWHTALFALNGYANKGKMAGSKSLSDLLNDKPQDESHALQRAQGIAFFHRLKAEGVPIEITRH